MMPLVVFLKEQVSSLFKLYRIKGLMCSNVKQGVEGIKTKDYIFFFIENGY